MSRANDRDQKWVRDGQTQTCHTWKEIPKPLPPSQQRQFLLHRPSLAIVVPYSAIIPHERILLKLFIVVSTDNVLINLRSRSRLQVLAEHQHENDYIEESDDILLERRWRRCGSRRRMDEGTELVDVRIGLINLKARVGHDGDGLGTMGSAGRGVLWKLAAIL